MSALLAGMKVGLMSKNNIKHCCLIHTESPVTVEQKLISYCKAIQRMYMDIQSREELGLTVLTRVVSMHIQSPSMVMEACKAMTCAANAVRGNREILGRQAVRAVMLAMTTHKNDADMQASGLLTLRALAHDVEETCMSLCDHDTLHVLLQRMESHRLDSYIRNAACSLFFSMSKSGGVHAVDAMLGAGVVPTVTKIMVLCHSNKSHGESEQNFQALRYGCGALGCIVVVKCGILKQLTSSAQADLFVFRKRMIQERVADTVIRALTVLGSRNLSIPGSADAGIHWYGVQALYNLFLDCQEGIQEFGFRAIRPVVVVMLRSSCSGQGAEFDHGQMFAVDVLQLVMQHCKIDGKHVQQDEFADNGGFRAAVRCLRMIVQYHGSGGAKNLGISGAELLLKTLSVVALAVEGHQNNQRRCGEEPQMLDTILRLVYNYPDGQVGRSACTVLDMITDHNEHITRMLLSKDALKVVTLAASEHLEESSNDMKTHESTDRLRNRLRHVHNKQKPMVSCLTSVNGLFRGIFASKNSGSAS